MLQHSGLSDGFWAEALLTTIHIINMSLSRPLGLQIPQELWTDSKSNYDKLRIFGCEAYALIPKDDHRKLEPRSRKHIFLVYGPNGEIGPRAQTQCSLSRPCTKRPKGLLKSEDHYRVQKWKDRRFHFQIPFTIVKIEEIYRNLLRQCHMFVYP